MFLRRILVFSVTLAFGITAYGQQPQTPSQERDSMRREDRSHDGMNRRGRHGSEKVRGMRELNLTDEQRQQQRAIVERHLQNIKSQREELFKLGEKRTQGSLTAEDGARAKALRLEIQQSRQGAQAEIETILTPEQRTKLDQIKNERKARRDEMRNRRQQRRDDTRQ
jgi:periplasmic protein CpxP/Spy